MTDMQDRLTMAEIEAWLVVGSYAVVLGGMILFVIAAMIWRDL